MISNRPKNMTNHFGQTLVSRGPGRWSGVALGCAALAATLFAGSASATENFGLRYAPGIGGGDMSAPLDPGWYGQIAAFAYHAGTVKNSPQGSNRTPVALGSLPYTYDTNAKIDVVGLFPRITYISTQKVLDANIGFTALFPLIQQKVESQAAMTASSKTFLTGTIGPTYTAAVAKGITDQAADDNHTGSQFGLGDIELAPIMRWSSDAHQVVFIPAVLLGTGDFKAGRAYNPGAGKFSTFRPTLQYSYIGEGWDFGIRGAFAINGRNKDTQYRSGNTWNFDWAAMKFINDSTRIGLQGYVIYQATDDTVKSAAEGGVSMYNTTAGPITVGRGQAYAAGPAISWIKDSGVLLLEGKVLKEFGVENRPEGTAAWLTLSKPL